MRVFRILLLGLLLGVTSCTIEPLDNYKGAVVYLKQNPPAGMRVVLKIEGTTDALKPYHYFIVVYVHELDYKRFEVGDTIK